MSCFFCLLSLSLSLRARLSHTHPQHSSTVVPRGLEPRTLRLLAVRSNQLSYETGCLRSLQGWVDYSRCRYGWFHLMVPKPLAQQPNTQGLDTRHAVGDANGIGRDRRASSSVRTLHSADDRRPAQHITCDFAPAIDVTARCVVMKGQLEALGASYFFDSIVRNYVPRSPRNPPFARCVLTLGKLSPHDATVLCTSADSAKT